MSGGSERKKRKKRGSARGLAVRRSPIDGKGCFATIFFPQGGRITEYAGERITRAEGLCRLRQQPQKRVSAIDSNWSIDGSIGGNGTEYINHSCDPSCMTMIIDGQIEILARRDIYPGDEITVDYLDIFDFIYRECNCQSEYCRGLWPI
jgi:SET domain-containing protein